MRKIRYFFKRKLWQIRNLFKWFPVIWKQYDFDYHYSTDVFRFQLEKQAEFFESGKTYTVGAEHNASRIRTALRLMDKVDNQEYGIEYQFKLEELYGKDVLDFEFEPTGREDGSSRLRHKYESYENKDEISVAKDKLFKESHLKQERAHRILWEFIAHNIRNWWD